MWLHVFHRADHSLALAGGSSNAFGLQVTVAGGVCLFPEAASVTWAGSPWAWQEIVAGEQEPVQHETGLRLVSGVSCSQTVLSGFCSPAPLGPRDPPGETQVALQRQCAPLGAQPRGRPWAGRRMICQPSAGPAHSSCLRLPRPPS